MSIFQRDTLNNSGADNNPNYVGRTQRDTLDNLGANNNPDFITQPRLPETSFQQVFIDLKEGWNMIAYTGIVPMNVREYCKLLFPYLNYSQGIDNALKDTLSIIKNNAGAFYWPEYGFEGIGPLEVGQGYMIKIEDDAGFQPGIIRPNVVEHFSHENENIIDLVTYTNRINNASVRVNEGWNTIGYSKFSDINVRNGLYRFFFPNGSSGHILGTDPNDEDTFGVPIDSTHFRDQNLVKNTVNLIDERLGDILNIIKNNDGAFYWPDVKFDGFGNLLPGQGYMLRTKDDDDPRGEITFPFIGRFPPASDIDPRPLIDGGPR